jgi:hypothetical protein
MEWIKGIWLVNFFFFALILLFVWSKTVIIGKKTAMINSLARKVDEMQVDESTPPPQPEDIEDLKR